jgi:hypothetical protein
MSFWKRLRGSVGEVKEEPTSARAKVPIEKNTSQIRASRIAQTTDEHEFRDGKCVKCGVNQSAASEALWNRKCQKITLPNLADLPTTLQLHFPFGCPCCARESVSLDVPFKESVYADHKGKVACKRCGSRWDVTKQNADAFTEWSNPSHSYVRISDCRHCGAKNSYYEYGSGPSGFSRCFKCEYKHSNETDYLGQYV